MEKRIIELILVVIGLISVGASLVVYAHSTFATKSTVEKLDDRVYQIWTETVPPHKRASLETQ